MTTKTEVLYHGLLTSLDMGVSKDGLISVNHNNKVVMVDGKKLVMPSEEIIKMPIEFWNDHVAFHPISENIYRSESEVMKRLENMVVAKLSSYIGYLLVALTSIAENKEGHSSLTPDQHKLLDIIKVADDKTVKFVSKVIGAAGGANRSYRLLRSTLKVGGKHLGRKWKRVSINTFPIFDPDNCTKNSIFGVKGRAADVTMLPALFKYLLPDSDKPAEYNFGSDDDSSPFFHALVNGYVRIIDKLNSVTETFSDYLEDDTFTEIDWVNHLDQLKELKTEILPLEGNKGVASRPTTTTVTNNIAGTKMTSTTKEKVSKATVVPAEKKPEAIKPDSNGMVSWNDICSNKANTPVNTAQPSFGGNSGGHMPMMPGAGFNNQPMMGANPNFNAMGNFNNQPSFGGMPGRPQFGGMNMNGFNNQPMMNNNPGFNNMGMGGFNNMGMGGFNNQPTMNNNMNGFNNQPMMPGNQPMMPGGNFNGMGGFNNQPMMNNNPGFNNMAGFNNQPLMPGGNFNGMNQPMNNMGMGGFNNQPMANTAGNFNAGQSVTYP